VQLKQAIRRAQALHGGPWYERDLASREDAERQALLEEHGGRVIRVT